MRIAYLNSRQQETAKCFASLKDARKACKDDRRLFSPTVARAYDGYHRANYLGYIVTEYGNTCPV